MLTGLVLSEFYRYLSIYIFDGFNSSFYREKYHAESVSPGDTISVLVFCSNELTLPLSGQQ
jgi:hypothetical protein